jgi:hypothetical protein
LVCKLILVDIVEGINHASGAIKVLREIFVIIGTVKPVYNDHPRDPKIVAVVDRWSLFGGHLCYKWSNWDLKIVAVIDRWSLFGGGR